MVSEASFEQAAYREAANVAQSGQRAYLYRFTYLSPKDRCTNWWRGAVHGDDQAYFLGPNDVFDFSPKNIRSYKDRWISNKWTEMVTNFVKSG